MDSIDYELTGPVGRARIGLIALQSDETIEAEIRDLLPNDVALFVTRIPSAADVTPASLAAMEEELPTAASLLPPTIRYDAVGYGCTSGATVIGEGRVTELVTQGANTKTVENPLTAVIEACSVLGINKLGFVTPYTFDISATMRNQLEEAGLEIGSSVTFNEAEEARVARISPTSIKRAVHHVATGVDGVFVSCTNLRALSIIEETEIEIGLPVLSSNLALGWHMLRMAGIKDCTSGFGRLMKAQL